MLKNRSEYLEYVGKLVRTKRKEKHLTQDELAKLVGYTCNDSISKIERGMIDVPANKISALCKALEIPPADLFINFLPQKETKETLYSDYAVIMNILETADAETMHQIRLIVETFNKG